MKFPDEMKQDKRWVAWLYENDPQHPNSIHHRKKVPYNLNSYCKTTAAVNDPSTWGTYQKAKTTLDFAAEHPERVKERQYGGVGFIIGDGWGFLDIDNSPTVIANHNLGETNLIDQVQQLLDKTYCEVSQSQAGFHFIFKVDSSVQRFNLHPKHSDRELYTAGRLAALTGKLLEPEQPMKITTIYQDQWEQLNKLIFGSYEPPTEPEKHGLSNIELSQFGAERPLSPQALSVVDEILQSSDAHQFIYWLSTDLPTISTNQSGQQFPTVDGELIDYDPSSQDITCCEMLAYWVRYLTGEYNSKLIDEIFKHTRLYRPKWERSDGNGTYGQRTIGQAVAYKKAQRERVTKKYKGMIIHGEK
jgi:primase-polymerase (primpol)-like protein